jgi:hypothetical protein
VSKGKQYITGRRSKGGWALCSGSPSSLFYKKQQQCKISGILVTIAAGDDFYKMSEQRKTEEEQTACLKK